MRTLPDHARPLMALFMLSGCKIINKNAGRLPEHFKFIEAETPRLCRKRKTKGKIRFLRSHSIRNFFDVSSVILIKKHRGYNIHGAFLMAEKKGFEPLIPL